MADIGSNDSNKSLTDQNISSPNDITESVLTRSYIINTETGIRLYFQHMPDQIQDTYMALYNPVYIIGRSEPLQLYNAGGPRMLNLNLFFSAQNTPEDVQLNLNFCRSLAYPIYRSNGVVSPPPVCILRLGTFLSMRAIVQGVNAMYSSPWELDTMTPMVAMVNLMLAQVNISPFDMYDVGKGIDTAEYGGRPPANRPTPEITRQQVNPQSAKTALGNKNAVPAPPPGIQSRPPSQQRLGQGASPNRIVPVSATPVSKPSSLLQQLNELPGFRGD